MVRVIDEKTKEDIEWIENKLARIQEDVKRLKTWGERYLDWIASRGYSRNTCKIYGQRLMRFVAFVEKKRVPWEDIFTLKNIERFRDCEPTVDPSAITGLAGYLFEEGEIPSRLSRKKIVRRLPTLYEDYLSYQVGSLEVSWQYRNNTRSVLKSFHEYLKRNRIKLESLNIEHVDEFLSGLCKNRALTTGRVY
jgi:site-specific recombinase XerD